MLKAPSALNRVRTIAAAAALILAVVIAVLPVAAHAAPAEAPAASSANSGVYKVKRGDTLGEIARYFGVTVKDIMVANGLTS